MTRLMVSLQARPSLLVLSTGPQANRLRRACCRVKKLHVQAFQGSAENRGASGLDVNGMRPTSPGAWTIMRDALKKCKVKMLSQQEVKFAADRDTAIIDIRPPAEFEAGHIKGSINIPFYRPITGWDTRKVLRRAGFAFFGVFNGTELNPDFFDKFVKTVSKEDGAVLVCNIGGNLDATETNDRGTQSRSLIAAYELMNMGYENIAVLKGGFNEWKRSERAYESDE